MTEIVLLTGGIINVVAMIMHFLVYDRTQKKANFVLACIHAFGAIAMFAAGLA